MIGISNITSIVEEPKSVEHAYKALLGRNAIHTANGKVSLRLKIGADILFRSPAEGAAEKILLPSAEPPYLSATTLLTDDLRKTQAVLSRNEVPFTVDDAGTVRVAPEHACGMVLRFAEQSN